LAPSPDRSLLARILVLDALLSRRLAASGPLRIPAFVLAHSGDSPLWLVGGIVAWVWGGSLWRPFALRVLVATVAGGAVATIFKWLFRRGRPAGPPAGLYGRFGRHAFPSGHAVRVACTAVVLSPLVSTWAGGLLTLWAVLVGLARVALQVHYLSDVVVGFALGGLVGLVWLAVI